MKRADKKSKITKADIPFRAEDPERKESRLKQNLANTIMSVKDNSVESSLERSKIKAGKEVMEGPPEKEEEKHEDGIAVLAEGILAAMKRGCTKEELCLEIGITPSKLTSLEREEDIIREAIEDGEIYARAWWLKTGRAALNQNSFNVGLWKTMMANRFGFSGETGGTSGGVNNFYTQVNIKSLSEGAVEEISNSLLDKPLLPDWGDWNKSG